MGWESTEKWEQFSDSHPTLGFGSQHDICLTGCFHLSFGPCYGDKKSEGYWGQAGQTLREYWLSLGRRCLPGVLGPGVASGERGAKLQSLKICEVNHPITNCTKVHSF